jgi:predicted small lipoprotein YifL
MVRRDCRSYSMTSKTPNLGRALLMSSAAILVACALSGCGRRGPLEPPEAAASSAPAPAAAAADTRLRRSRTTTGQATPPTSTLTTRPAAVVEDTPDDEQDESESIQSVIPTPNPTPRKRGRDFVVPKEPFILDPLL